MFGALKWNKLVCVPSDLCRRLLFSIQMNGTASVVSYFMCVQRRYIKLRFCYIQNLFSELLRLCRHFPYVACALCNSSSRGSIDDRQSEADLHICPINQRLHFEFRKMHSQQITMTTNKITHFELIRRHAFVCIKINGFRRSHYGLSDAFRFTYQITFRFLSLNCSICHLHTVCLATVR